MSSMIMFRSTRGAARVLKLKGMWERPRAPKEFCVGYVRSWLPRAAVAASPARVELGWPAQPARAFATAASRRAALPEHVEMPMPRLVPSMEQGVISRWLVEEGACPALEQPRYNSLLACWTRWNADPGACARECRLFVALALLKVCTDEFALFRRICGRWRASLRDRRRRPDVRAASCYVCLPVVPCYTLHELVPRVPVVSDARLAAIEALGFVARSS